MNARGLGPAIGLLVMVLPAASPVAATPEGDRLYQSASAKYAAKDYRGAIADAEAATVADPAHWQAWQLDGNARYAIGDTAGAVTVYRYALRIHPDNPGLQTFVDSLAAPASPAAPAQPAAQPAAHPGPASGAASSPAAAPRPVEPGGLRVALYGGYQMVGLGSFEDYFKELYADVLPVLVAFGYTPTLTIVVPGGGVAAGAEVTRPFAGTPFGVGVRADTLLVPDVTSHFSSSSSTSTQTEDYRLAMTVIRLMLGGTARPLTFGRLRLGGGLWAGWALLSVNWSSHDVQTVPSMPSLGYDRSGSMTLTGGGPAAAVEVEAAISVVRRCEVFMCAGYTYTRLTEVVTDRAYDYDGDGDLDFPAGAVVADQAMNPVVYDLGGPAGRAGVRVLF